MGAGAAAGTALIKLPSSVEVERFTQAPDIVIGPPPLMPQAPYAHWMMGGPVYVQNEAGEFEPIGYVREITINTSIEEYPSWNGEVTLVPGLKRGSLTFGGPW